MISIVIPACNEEAVIGRTLRALTSGSAEAVALVGTRESPCAEDRGQEVEKGPTEAVRIIVVCNGCRDQTADAAREVANALHEASNENEVSTTNQFVIEVVESEPGKATALNHGDVVAGEMELGDVRVYLDADVTLSAESLARLVRTLRTPGVLAASPNMRVNVENRPWMVRAFYRRWQKSAFHRIGRLGSGVYAVNEEGRRRFRRFPDIIADDEFVRRRFVPGERVVVRDASFTIEAPHRIWALIQVKTRSRLGRLELNRLERQGVLPRRSESDVDPSVREDQPVGRSSVLDQLAYGMVTIISRVRARVQFLTRSSWTWERDESTRHAFETSPEHRGESHVGSPAMKRVTRTVTSW